MNKLILCLLLVVCVLQSVTAQKMKAWVKAADQAFYAEEDYYKAFMYYDAALKYKDPAGYYRLLYQKAEAARLIGAAVDARDAYLKLLAEAPQDTLSSAPYNCVRILLGGVQISLAYPGSGFNPADYQEANNSFSTPTEQAYASGVCAEELEKGRAVINFVNQDQGFLTNEAIDLQPWVPFNPSMNFAQAPWPWADSTDTTPKRSTRFFPQFYLAGKDGQYYASTAGNLPLCMGTYLENTAINRTKSRVYFTTCESKSGDFSTQCNLYYQALNSQGNPEGEQVEISELKTGAQALIQIQPAISWDETRQREVLYFVSNRPGGRGGMDIWKSELDETGGRFLPPTNEASVNTAGDEMTPFYQSGVLYFSSNGQTDRYGGFDLFSWDPLSSNPENMGQKINSSADDFGYSRNAAETQAFLVSNRQSILLPSAERSDSCAVSTDSGGCCCLNNFTYEIPACFLEVTTLFGCDCPDGGTCAPLEGVEVVLYDITDGSVDKAKKGVGHSTVSGNKYIFSNRLRPNRKYQLVGHYQNKDQGVVLEAMSEILDFTNGFKPCTNGSSEQATLTFKCENPYLNVQVYREDEAFPLRKAKVRLVDITDRKNLYDQGTGASSSQDPCAGINNQVESIPGEIVISPFSPQAIAFDRTYLILVNSDEEDLLPGKDTLTVFRDDAELCGSLTCEKKIAIFLNPKPPQEGPPKLELFFDNARPRWAGAPNRSRDQDIPEQSYLEALDIYKNQSQAYLNQFAGDSEEDGMQKLELGIFFSNELTPSDQKLNDFVQDVKKLLCQDVSVTIQAKGCTSPKFKLPGEKIQINFNDHLQNRRVNSVQKDLEKLGLSQEVLGDRYQFEQIYETCTLVNPLVPLKDLQDQNNRKLSVFSIDAAKARRVEIEVIVQPAKPSIGSQ